MSRQHQQLLGQCSEAGATMIEFALASIFVIMVIGGLFDVGMAMHDYTMLEHVTEDAARNIAVQTNVGANCNRIVNYLQNDAQNHLERRLGVTAKNDVDWTITNLSSELATGAPPGPFSASGPFKAIRLAATIRLNCYFLCSIVPEFRVTATSDSIVQSSFPVEDCL